MPNARTSSQPSQFELATSTSMLAVCAFSIFAPYGSLVDESAIASGLLLCVSCAAILVAVALLGASAVWVNIKGVALCCLLAVLLQAPAIGEYVFLLDSPLATCVAAACSGFSFGIASVLCGSCWASLVSQMKKQRFLALISSALVCACALLNAVSIYAPGMVRFAGSAALFVSLGVLYRLLRSSFCLYAYDKKTARDKERAWKPFVFAPYAVGCSLGALPPVFALAREDVSSHVLLGLLVGGSVVLMLGAMGMSARIIQHEEHASIFVMKCMLVLSLAAGLLPVDAGIACFTAAAAVYLIFHTWITGIKVAVYDLCPVGFFCERFRALFLAVAVGGLMASVVIFAVGEALASVVIPLACYVVLAMNRFFERPTWLLQSVVDAALYAVDEDAGPDLERAGNEHVALYREACADLDRGHELTEREMDVMELLVRGFNSDSVAARLCISPSTVRTHTAHVYRKIGVGGQQELIDAAERAVANRVAKTTRDAL